MRHFAGVLRIAATCALAVTLVPGRAEAQAPTAGLKGHWTLDDPAGSLTAAESSGESVPAACWWWQPWRCPTFETPGKIGTAAAFDGATQFVDVPNNIPNTFTITAWIKTTQNGGGWGPAYSGVGVIWADVGGGGPDMIPMALVNGQLAFGTGENCCNFTYDTLTSTMAVNTGEWVHVAVTRNTVTGEKQLYINGVLNGSNFNGGNFPLDYNFNGAISIGANWLDNRYYSGQVDDVHFYDRVLTPAEIAAFVPPPTPEEQAEAIEELIGDLGLDAGAGGALTSKLNAALAQIIAGNTTPAKNQLGAFVNQVRALVRSRRLTDGQAQPLIDAANTLAGSL